MEGMIKTATCERCGRVKQPHGPCGPYTKMSCLEIAYERARGRVAEMEARAALSGAPLRTSRAEVIEHLREAKMLAHTEPDDAQKHIEAALALLTDQGAPEARGPVGPPLDAQSVNQCDGCRAGRPVDEHGNHAMGEAGGYRDLMACQAARYASPNAVTRESLPQEVAQMADNAPPSQEQVAIRMLALLENVNDSLGRFEYLENLRAEEAKKEIEADVAQADKREAAQTAFEERQERTLACSERTAAALEKIASVLDFVATRAAP